MASEPIPEHANFCPPLRLPPFRLARLWPDHQLPRLRPHKYVLAPHAHHSFHFLNIFTNTPAAPLADLTPAIGEVATTLHIPPSNLLRRLTGRAATATEAEEAVIDEECPKCGHVGLSYRTAQLRGLDERQTIFYTCLNKACVHKYKLNS